MRKLRSVLTSSRPYEFVPNFESCIVREINPSESGTPDPGGVADWFIPAATSSPSYNPLVEHVWVVVLTSRMKPVGFSLIHIGTANESFAAPAQIIRAVLSTGHKYFVLIHNHPGGDPSPSRGDHDATRRVSEVSRACELEFVDHLVLNLTDRGYPLFFSFREAGLI